MLADRVVRGELEDQFLEFAMATFRQTYDVRGIYATFCFSLIRIVLYVKKGYFPIRYVLT